MIPKIILINEEQAEIDKELFGDVIVSFWEYSWGDTLSARISLPQLAIGDLKDHGHIIMESNDSYSSRMGGAHWSLNTPMCRMHDDAIFAETGFSGAAQTENSDYDTRWWELPRRQTAIEKHFGVPAGTFS